MKSYAKFVPNVWLLKSDTPHSKWETVSIPNKYGKEKEHIVHNLVKERGWFYFYSITRADGTNAQTIAEKKAERLAGFQESAEKKSSEYYQKSKRFDDFLSLAEPIKVGHHSEKRHRAVINKVWNDMWKSVEFQEKAESYESRIQYWESRKDIVNLSMPESLEYFEHLVDVTTKKHEWIKSGAIQKAHEYSLTYANKARKEAEKNLELAKILWGEVSNPIPEPKKEEKKPDFDWSAHGGFFAFGQQQFDEKKKEGVEYVHAFAWLFLPKENYKAVLDLFDAHCNA